MEVEIGRQNDVKKRRHLALHPVPCGYPAGTSNLDLTRTLLRRPFAQWDGYGTLGSVAKPAALVMKQQQQSQLQSFMV